VGIDLPMWPPPVISCCLNPINHSYKYHKS
jgi:hypothetical protein